MEGIMEPLLNICYMLGSILVTCVSALGITEAIHWLWDGRKNAARRNKPVLDTPILDMLARLVHRIACYPLRICRTAISKILSRKSKL